MSKGKMTELIVSYDAELLENRFNVKVSKMGTGVHKASYLIVAQDLLEDGFMLKFFKDKDSAGLFLQLLKLSN